MASYDPAQCCTVGVKHEGTPTGEMKMIDNIEAYIAYPKSKQTHTAILLLPDVIGHAFVNAQLIADQFAANNYLVVMPDQFRGDALKLNRPESFDFPSWLAKHTPDVTGHIIDRVKKYMKEELGVKKTGCVGYCFGAKGVVRGLAEGGGIDVGYTAHPSFVSADDIKAIKGPLSIAAAETDQIFPEEKRHETEKILKEIGATYQMNLFSGVEHGFAVRGDIRKKEAKYAKEQAFLQAVNFMDFYLGRPE